MRAIAVLLGGWVAVVAARVPKDDPLPAVTAEHIKTSQNNLKQIALGFFNYEFRLTHFPSDITDKEGKPLLSWRVAILPYLPNEPGVEELYKQFKLGEPWDSPNNKKLIEKMPKVYAPIRVKAKAGETYYQTFTGEKALFGGKVKNPRILDIRDGTADTALVVEAGEPVIWTKPADIPFDEKKAAPKLGGMFDGECNVVRCDSTVLRMKKDPDEKELKKLIMPADGEVIDFKKLAK